MQYKAFVVKLKKEKTTITISDYQSGVERKIDVLDTTPIGSLKKLILQALSEVITEKHKIEIK